MEPKDILDGVAFFAFLVVLYFGWLILCAAHGPLN